MRSPTLLVALLAAAAATPALASPTSPKPANPLENRSSGTASVWKAVTPVCDGTPADWRWVSPGPDCLEYKDASGASQPLHAVKWLGSRCAVSVYTGFGCTGTVDSATQGSVCWDSPTIEIKSFRIQC
ncbi:hypothetical protein Hte_011673 [Hypoxylon texense]